MGKNTVSSKPNKSPIYMNEVFNQLLNSGSIIILATLIGAMIAYLISVIFVTPMYSSSTKFYVMADEQQENSNSVVDNGALQAGALLTKDYEQIIESPEVIDSVIYNLNLKDNDDKQMTDQELTKKISISIPEETRVVNITVKDDDPYRACDIANEVRNVAEERIQNIMEMNTVKTVANAQVPMKADSPNKIFNTLIGGLTGFVISIIAVLMQYIFNNTIQTSEDIQNYLGISVLATIPLAKSKNYLRRKTRKNHATDKNQND